MIIEEEKAITETEKSVPTASTVDRDGQWKEVSCEFFDDLLAAALPELLEAMDTDKRPEFQEQELRAVATTTGKKERLFIFMEALLRPKEEEALKEYRKYLEEVKTKEGEKMAYVSVPEEMGIEKGIEKGIVIGAEGTKRENALRMLRKGLDIDLIAECVDLPEEEVRRLADENIHD